VSDWYDEVFEDRIRFGLRVERTVFSGKSEYQAIDIVDTKGLGRALALDGRFMTSEGDEFFYHEMLVHPSFVTAPSIARVLVIGGGDGGTVREVLRHAEVERVLLLEIDREVVELSKEHLGTIGTAWDDPRLEVRIADGIEYVKTSAAARSGAGSAEPSDGERGPGESHSTGRGGAAPSRFADTAYDVVLLDGTDPIGPAVGLFDEAFYRGVARMLSPRGVFVLQSESPILTRDLFFEIQDTLAKVYPRVHPYFAPVPCYAGGFWSFTFCSFEVDPLAIRDERAVAIEPSSKVYNRDYHRAVFARPSYARR
jgi:spermidine synthase